MRDRQFTQQYKAGTDGICQQKKTKPKPKVERNKNKDKKKNGKERRGGKKYGTSLDRNIFVHINSILLVGKNSNLGLFFL